ncbi:ABC transporter permease subunit [uncultured Eubacterium sp.]|uniref:ABC transporter permease subunit n=1 Tax=uncultured Eubacterium sp. TaxID=165185 RepID=UPI00280499D9|nr:ABC transporter permease subunit [uncultured Eubacterium sp.]
MKRIGTLYAYELKKIASRKIVWIVGIIMIFLCAFLSFSDLISSSYYGEDEISGYEAMKINREYARNLADRKIDDTLLREMQDYYSREDVEESNDSISDGQISIITDESQEDEIDKGIKEYTPIYAYVKEITEDSNMALKISSDELYKMREKSILQNRTDQMLTEKEMDYWEEKDKQIETPFTYEYTESWSNLWNYMYTINFMILLMLAICLSNVFSVEYLRKTDAIILCSQYGKKHLYLAKVLAGISFGVIIAILFFGITAISSICVYGADGFSAALQIAFPLSSWNISVGESVLVLLFVLLIISVLYSVAIVILSEILKNSVAVMAIPVGIMILTMMIDIPYQFRIASQIYDLLPTNLLTVWELWDDRLVSVFGKYLTNFQIAPILYLIIIIVLFFVGKRVYLKHQIGAR